MNGRKSGLAGHASLITVILVASAVFAALFIHWRERYNTIPESSRPVAPPRLGKVAWSEGNLRHLTPVHGVAKDPGTQTDWHTLFVSSHDYFAFVKLAARAANQGNGSAALYIAKALRYCELEVWMYRSKRSEDSTQLAREESWQSQFPLAAQHMSEQFQDHYALCKGFFTMMHLRLCLRRRVAISMFRLDEPSI